MFVFVDSVVSQPSVSWFTAQKFVLISSAGSAPPNLTWLFTRNVGELPTPSSSVNAMFARSSSFPSSPLKHVSMVSMSIEVSVAQASHVVSRSCPAS